MNPTNQYSRGETLILNLLRLSAQATNEVSLKLENQQDANRWDALDPSVSDCGVTALMAYRELLTGPRIPHRDQDGLSHARQKYSDAWYGLIQKLGGRMSDDEEILELKHAWRSVDDLLVQRIEEDGDVLANTAIENLEKTLIKVATKLRKSVKGVNPSGIDEKVIEMAVRAGTAGLKKSCQKMGRGFNRVAKNVATLSRKYYGDDNAVNKRSAKNDKVVKKAIDKYYELVQKGTKPIHATTDACREIEAMIGIGEFASFESFRDAVKTEIDKNQHAIPENLDVVIPKIN